MLFEVIFKTESNSYVWNILRKLGWLYKEMATYGQWNLLGRDENEQKEFAKYLGKTLNYSHSNDWWFISLV